MFLKNYLIEVFKKASLENNVLLKENIVLKWVHRFGIDTLNDLLIHSPTLQENQHKKEKQEQISLIDESKQDENKNEELISIELSKTTGPLSSKFFLSMPPFVAILKNCLSFGLRVFKN